MEHHPSSPPSSALTICTFFPSLSKHLSNHLIACAGACFDRVQKAKGYLVLPHIISNNASNHLIDIALQKVKSQYSTELGGHRDRSIGSVQSGNFFILSFMHIEQSQIKFFIKGKLSTFLIRTH